MACILSGVLGSSFWLLDKTADGRMAQKRDLSGNQKGTPALQDMATPSGYTPATVAPIPEPVYALVLERASADASEATVRFAKRDYERADGRPITTIAQLTDTVRDHVLKYHADFIFYGEPLVFGEDPRERGDPNDRRKSPAKPLRLDMLGQEIADDEDLGPARRGHTGRANPYFVLVTRRPSPKLQATFPSLPVDPLDFVRAQFPSDPIEIIEFVTPTANLARQGREKEVRQAWSKICSNAAENVRRNMPYIYGTSGSGKTALLRYIFERSDRDLDCSEFTPAEREWIGNVAMLAITFNDGTPVSDFDLQMFRIDGAEFVPVVMRLLFAQQSMVDWDDFSDALAQAYDAGVVDGFKLGSLTQVLEQLGPWDPANEDRQYVVLLVDELAKVEAKLKLDRATDDEAERAVNRIRRSLCEAMDRKPFQVLFSSLSVKPMDLETKSNRTVTRLGLPSLAFDDAAALFKSSISHEFFVDLARTDGDSEALIHARLARLSGGHPRTIEAMCRTFAVLAKKGQYRVRHAVQAATQRIMEQYYEPLSNFPWGLFLAVLIGTEVFVKSPIFGERPTLDFDSGIECGYLINAAPQAGKVQPRVSELQLRTLSEIFAGLEAVDRRRIILNSLKELLDTVDIDGKKFATFHMKWEILRRNAIVEAASWTASRVIDFYACNLYHGQLAETFIELTQAPTEVVNFPALNPWQPISETFSECPPGRNHPDLLRYVWCAERCDFPVIDFVIFVLAHDGRIIPLAFQSKYSADDSSTELGNSTVSSAYEVAKKIMRHAGWEPDEFIFVVHAYRDTAGNILPDEPEHSMTTRSAHTTPNRVTNVMLLDKPTLQHLYGSLGFTVEYAWLRRQVHAGK